MTYQTHTDVSIRQLDNLLNMLAGAGWRLHTLFPSGTNYLVIMQIEKQ